MRAGVELAAGIGRYRMSVTLVTTRGTFSCREILIHIAGVRHYCTAIDSNSSYSNRSASMGSNRLARQAG